jgi:RNA polymerase sigma factor (sigma-70 family)
MNSSDEQQRLTALQEQLAAVFTRVQRNEAEAFAEFHDLLSQQLMAYCLSFTRDVDEAKDLFQTVMLAVFEYRHRYVAGNITGWVFTIARNACRRWERRQRIVQPLDEAYDVAAPENSAALDSDEVAAIQHAVLQLDAPFRDCIMLHYFGGMKIDDIAEALSISTSLVKVRMHRARTALQTTLANFRESLHV